MPSRNAWADYTEVDIVMAVRRFSDTWTAYDKPATKLFNAWLAGVVPIVGMEAAYAAEGRQGENCLVVRGLEDLKARLLELRNNPAALRALQQAGAEAAKARSAEAVAMLWIQTLTEVIQPAACRWQATGPLLASLATVWARFKAGLAWRGYLLAFCRVQEK